MQESSPLTVKAVHLHEKSNTSRDPTTIRAMKKTVRPAITGVPEKLTVSKLYARYPDPARSAKPVTFNASLMIL